MSASPLPHQLPALVRHVEVLAKKHASLEASIPGFGKTFVACFLAQYLGRRLAVLCPKSVIVHWQRAAAACGVGVIFVTNYEQAKLDKFKHGHWAVKGRKYQWDLPADALLCLDEGHRCKDRTTMNAKLMTAAKVAGMQAGVKTLVMSATAAKDPMDLYALGYILDLHAGVDFIGWSMNFGVRRGPFAFEFLGSRADLDRLNQAMFPAHGYRATYADIPGFPMNTVEAFPVNIAEPESIDELYEQAEALELLGNQATEPIVIRLRARQKAELLKMPIFAEMIGDHNKEGESVVVFVNFLESLDLLLEKFPKAAVIRGGQTSAQRQAEIDRFQANKIDKIFCQVLAGKEGISLDDTTGENPRVTLISPPESAVALVQVLGRIHRTTSKSPARQKIVFAENTVEKRVRVAVQKKVKDIETINDGDLNAAIVDMAVNDAVAIFSADREAA